MGSDVERVEDMPVYRQFYDLALKVEKACRLFGPDFRWLRGQALRSSQSVCANMTEGFYSQYSTEYLQCLCRCRREGRETLTHLNYGCDVSQLDADRVQALGDAYENALTELSRLIASIERKIQRAGKGKPGSHRVRESESEYVVRDLHQPLTMIY